MLSGMPSTDMAEARVFEIQELSRREEFGEGRVV